MHNRELVVRIIQPAPIESGQQKHLQKKAAEPAVPEKKKKNWFQIVINGLALTLIAALGVYFAISFFHFGFSFKDIMVLVGIPLAVGIVTTYAIF
jgi:hypothetical protein